MSETFGGTQQVAPAGWYADPGTAGQYRWWDGAQWTAHTSAPQAAPAYAGPTAPGYAASTRPAYSSYSPTRVPWWRSPWVIGGIVAAVVAAGAVIAAVSVHSSRQKGAKAAVSAYLSALQHGDYAGAYNQLCYADKLDVNESAFAAAKAGIHPVGFTVVKVLTQGSPAISAQVFYDETESTGEALVGSLPAQKGSDGWRVCHALEPGENWLGVTVPYVSG